VQPADANVITRRPTLFVFCITDQAIGLRTQFEVYDKYMGNATITPNVQTVSTIFLPCQQPQQPQNQIIQGQGPDRYR